MKPEITKIHILDIQVCVPADWTDSQVTEFANKELECGTKLGWQIRKEGDGLLAGDKERVDCAGKSGYVHIMLDA